MPRLTGQNVEYLGHALSMFEEGTRASPIMQPIARTLGNEEIAQLADHFSKEHAPPVEATAAVQPERVLAGKALAETGAANVLPCFSCHGSQGNGVGARFPSIAGEPAKFVVNRFLEFQERALKATPQPLTMTAVSTTLNQAQIEDVAAYLSQLGR